MPNDITPVSKPTKRYNPTRSEVVKTVIIAVLITGIVAFIAGNSYANSRQAEVRNAVEKATAVKAPALK